MICLVCADIQKYTVGTFDILFATNVLHATRDMEVTIQNCKALLRKGGLLIANELTTKTEFLTLTFGLTDGWWLHDDSNRRIPGSPLLSRQVLVPVFCSLCSHAVLKTSGVVVLYSTADLSVIGN